MPIPGDVHIITDDTGDTGFFLRSELICSLVDVGKSESLTSTAILVDSFPDQKVIPIILQFTAAVFHQLFALLASKQLLMSSNLHLRNELHKKNGQVYGFLIHLGLIPLEFSIWPHDTPQVSIEVVHMDHGIAASLHGHLDTDGGLLCSLSAGK